MDAMLEYGPLLAACAVCLIGATVLYAADSPWLYGIHWYGETYFTDVEAMTGNKGIWTLETIIGHDLSQVGKFNTIVARGHIIIARIQPQWGLNVPRPEGLASYLNAVEAVANAYANSVHIWQIGNEPNLYIEYEGSELTAEQYIAAYKAIRERIHRVTSARGRQIVLVGAVSPGPRVAGVRHTSGSAYLSRMCDLLGPDDLDGFSIHAYAAPWSSLSASLTEFRNSYVEQLNIIDNKGFASYPVYMTEWNRQVNPVTAANEAISAQFLRSALQGIAQWNATPGNHPIVCACWFIYPDVEQWREYSLLYLRSLHARGANNDLWDAFQAAAAMNYPAGNDQPGSPRPTHTPTPTLTPTSSATPTATPPNSGTFTAF